MRRWATPVILLALAGVMVFGLWWGWRMLTHPIDNSSNSCVTTSASTLSSSQVQVRVLNAGTVAGSAAGLAQALSAKGFTVASTSNTSTTVDRTTVVGTKADAPEVKLVAGFLPGARLVGDGRSNHQVDVIIDNSFGGITQDAPTTVNVPGGTICVLASSASTTP